MRLYRVFPYDPTAAPDAPGGALFVPRGGLGRFDNPALYRAFYASLDPHGAIIERFGESDVWVRATFLQPPGDSQRPLGLALATYDTPATFADLALVEELSHLRVTRVTEIISRDRAQTQALARRALQRHERTRAGLCWWSYYDPALTNAMLWDSTGVSLASAPEILSPSHPLVGETARRMHRGLGAGR